MSVTGQRGSVLHLAPEWSAGEPGELLFTPVVSSEAVAPAAAAEVVPLQPGIPVLPTTGVGQLRGIKRPS